jgi:hypothetical protein
MHLCNTNDGDGGADFPGHHLYHRIILIIISIHKIWRASTSGSGVFFFASFAYGWVVQFGFSFFYFFLFLFVFLFTFSSFVVLHMHLSHLKAGARIGSSTG